ncbi:glycosyltransferase [Nostoc sp.]|uniref:glycosyltransferase n=1 Tax=Nostoc sp. TaxID=1180 RepID=UPI002FFCB0B3
MKAQVSPQDVSIPLAETAPSISVAICTYNRADRLYLALDALRHQTLAAERFDILVVDNASTDRTPEVCQEFASSLPHLRYVFEPVQGLSKARNTALQEVKSSYIAFLDDDAIPCPSWLASLLHTFQTVRPEPVCVGGLIRPLWELPKPDWVHPTMETLFTILDGGDQPRWFRPNEFPWGANVAYQRDALLKIGGFHEKLGRRGKSLLSGEEYLLNATLQSQGGGFYYHPEAAIEHWIPKERIDPNWLVRRNFWQGRSVALIENMLGKSRTRQQISSLWRLLLALLDSWKLINPFESALQIRIPLKMELSLRWGYFVETWLPPST